jgi:acyl-coenzyme A synthetase/AMP-(fatty) acid ligase
MIVNRIYEWALKQPDKPAIIDDDVPITYADFAHGIDTARRHLAKHDLPVGMTAVVLVHHQPRLWFIILALRSLGMNTICVESLERIEKLGLKNVGAVVTTPDDIAFYNIARPRVLGRKIISLADSIWRAPRSGQPTPIDDPDRPYGGHILYTSGTTGEYKKVLVEGRHEEARVVRCVVQRRIQPDSIVHMLTFGLWTGAGFKQASSAWRAGATVVMDSSPKVLKNFFRHRPSFVSIAPAQAQDLLAQTATVRRPATMPIVNLVGGFVSQQLIKSLRNAQFNDLMINYSSTECSHVLRSYLEDSDQISWLMPASDRRVEIVDEDDRPCAIGQEGRLRVALFEHDAHGYLDDPVTTASVFRDGWFYPGDLAVQREDGRIRILGRAGDVLNVKGQKVTTAPLEQAVREFLELENVCLFQSVGADGVEELTVVVEADEVPTQAQAARVKATFRMFERIHFKAIKAFPRTTTGLQKIRRLELRKIVFGASA